MQPPQFVKLERREAVVLRFFSFVVAAVVGHSGRSGSDDLEGLALEKCKKRRREGQAGRRGVLYEEFIQSRRDIKKGGGKVPDAANPFLA